MPQHIIISVSIGIILGFIIVHLNTLNRIHYNRKTIFSIHKKINFIDELVDELIEIKLLIEEGSNEAAINNLTKEINKLIRGA